MDVLAAVRSKQPFFVRIHDQDTADPQLHQRNGSYLSRFIDRPYRCETEVDGVIFLETLNMDEVWVSSCGSIDATTLVFEDNGVCYEPGDYSLFVQSNNAIY